METAELADGRALRCEGSAGARALSAVHQLRRAWKAVLTRLTARQTIPRAFVEELNAHLAADLTSDRLHSNGKGAFQLGRSPSSLAGPSLALATLARCIADFLVTADLQYLRRCANTESCVVHFYDTTKNHRRQWCSNATCGNRHKVAEFRKRQRAAAGA